MLKYVIAVVRGVAGRNRRTQQSAQAAVCAARPPVAAAMLAALLLLPSACSRGANEPPALATSEPSPEVETVTIAPDVPAPADAGSELAGTSWRLVEIASMDDTVDVPADRALYTLSFGADRTMNLLADCNRGTGTWNSASPGQLEFGPIAATQAQCPPGSLHDTYMAQFPWVRSYVLKDGHLFLATMADGSIVEFEREP